MTNKSNLSFWQKVALELMWFWCRLISIMPRWFKFYFFADIVFFIVYRCCRYRVKIVDKNLKNSFPELTDNERVKIRKDFYHYLTEVMVTTICLAGGRPQKTVIGKHAGAEIAELKEKTKGRSWVALTAHYGLWEYFMFWAQYADQALVAVYHPLENKVFDELFKRLRNHKNVNTVPIKDTIRYCLEHQDGIDGMNYVIGLIADQNPPRRPNSMWFKFLNQDTIFFDGGEKIALKLHLPIYFVYQHRLGRGLYQIRYELIHDGEEKVEPYEITRRYVEKLERVIKTNPHQWLWSHRRWKHNPNRQKWQKR